MRMTWIVKPRGALYSRVAEESMMAKLEDSYASVIWNCQKERMKETEDIR